jgi:hypothetical protein
MNITAERREAWDYLLDWRDRSRPPHYNRSEDAVYAAMRFLRPVRVTLKDISIGRTAFSTLGDDVEVELYDPLRIMHGATPYHESGMPFQGLLSVRRGFEDSEASLTHIAPNGELYRSTGSVAMDRITKLAVIQYFDTRVDAHMRTLGISPSA